MKRIKQSSVVLLILFMWCECKLSGQSDSLTFRIQWLYVDNNEACDIGDINRDGLLDIVAGRNWYPAPDYVPRPVRAIALHPPDYAKNNGEHLYDVDQDGWLDVVTTGWGETRILWFRNPGEVGLIKGIPWQVEELADVGHGHGEIGSLQDLDGDGIPEYIVNSYVRTNALVIWKLFQNEHPRFRSFPVGEHNSHGVGFGDINGDGKADILFDDGWYQQPERISEDQPWRLHRDWQWSSGSCPMIVTDLNGDNRNDIIRGRGHDYGLYWQEQKESIGDRTIWQTHLIDSTWSQAHALTWTDLNGDDRPELIAGKRKYAHSGKDPGAEETASIYVYFWDQSNHNFRRHILVDGVGTGLFIRVADLNEDQRPDIVVAGKTGTAILWQE